MSIFKTGVVALAMCVSAPVWAQALAPREVPAKSLPVPTDVSPMMQSFIAQPLRAGWDKLPANGEEWKATAAAGAAATLQILPAMRERLHVKVEPTTIDGVRAYIVTPDTIPPENKDRLLVHVHGGCYLLSPGEAATPEAILLAGIGHFKVISVDYRMPPEAYFPAALDDAVTVYKAATKMADPKKMAIFGTSACADVGDDPAGEGGRRAAAGGDRFGHADVRRDERGGQLSDQRAGGQRAGVPRRVLRCGSEVLCAWA